MKTISKQGGNGMATIKDVAQLAGVSASSVSRYFNNKELLSPESLKRIESAVHELNYYPSSLGRNLRFSRSGKLLALLPTISNPFYHRILNAISKECEQYGYTMITCTTGMDKYTEQNLYHMLHSHYADGAIIFGSALGKSELALAKSAKDGCLFTPGNCSRNCNGEQMKAIRYTMKTALICNCRMLIVWITRMSC